MDAPKDPDTRPGPPPSASVPLGMGMYCASALHMLSQSRDIQVSLSESGVSLSQHQGFA